MNICFIMYPWENISPETDTTLTLIHEAYSRGHQVAVTTGSNLTIRDSITLAWCWMLQAKTPVTKNMVTFHKQMKFKEQMLPLAGFDAIIMRANPPLDNIVLNFLDSVKDDVFIMNNVEGLREANNKLYTAAFYDPNNEMIPRTFVSKNKKYLKDVIDEMDAEKMIMKPLNGYGGSGVIVIEKGANSNINSLLDFYISGKGGESNYVILQEYVEGAEFGDVRVLLLHGEAIGAMRRIPAKDDARSNISAGGKVEKYVLNKAEKRLCKTVGSKLVEDGLYFVGLDLIGGKLIEVNVLSPGGIAYINKLNKTRLQVKVIDYVEDMVKARERSSVRLAEFKERVRNA